MKSLQTQQSIASLWLAMIVCAAYSAGCGNQDRFNVGRNLRPDAENIEPLTFQVGDRQFSASGQLVTLRNSNQECFVLIVCPWDQRGKYRTAVGYDMKVGSGEYRFLGKLILEDDKELHADVNTVYYIDGGRVSFSRKMEEWDTGQPSVSAFLNPEHLRPLLETMIREHPLSRTSQTLENEESEN